MLPAKEVKSRETAFCNMICLLLEDMPEGEVKDLVKLGVVHQHVVKRKYRASAQDNYVESQMQSNNNHSQCILSSSNPHTHLPANNPSPVFATNPVLPSTFSS